uniref:Putative secreted protein n=1 Tax=Ixodes ricinus TaxID=34613 RepID=A0A6B0TXL1_IXORI
MPSAPARRTPLWSFLAPALHTHNTFQHPWRFHNNPRCGGRQPRVEGGVGLFSLWSGESGRVQVLVSTEVSVAPQTRQGSRLLR